MPSRSEITFADQYIDEPEITPVNSTKTFVGSNGTYYDEHWRFMEWRGRRRSWNWAAALTFGGWLAYRRMYPAAALFVIWLGLLVALAVNGVLLWPSGGRPGGRCSSPWGAYGNVLYMRRFRRAALKAAQGDGQHQDRLDALARSGGTSRLGGLAHGHRRARGGGRGGRGHVLGPRQHRAELLSTATRLAGRSLTARP